MPPATVKLWLANATVPVPDETAIPKLVLMDAVDNDAIRPYASVVITGIAVALPTVPAPGPVAGNATVTEPTVPVTEIFPLPELVMPVTATLLTAMLPAAVTKPAVVTLPPITLAVALSVVPEITFAPEILPPDPLVLKFPNVPLPVAEINPLVSALPSLVGAGLRLSRIDRDPVHLQQGV